MNSTSQPSAQIAAEIEELRSIERRIEKLTGGEVDTVADSEGTLFVLRRAQETLREAEMERLRVSELRLQRHNRVYAMLSGINSLIVRAQSREELFQGACRIALEAGAFKMAWIGVLNCDTQDGVAVASAGGESDYIEQIRFSLRKDGPGCKRPASRALRESQPVLCNDVSTDADAASVRDEFIARGHLSAGYFPLCIDGACSAVFALMAGERDVFDAEETDLLLQLVGDISFALDHLSRAEQLQHMAFYDPLTGLANRRLFIERATQYVRIAHAGGHKLAVYVVDLERFKNINDTFGQATGDNLLKQLARWLVSNLGDVNLVARVGADLFAVLLPEARREEDIARKLEKSLDAFMHHPFQFDASEFRVAVKVGVAVFPDDGDNAETLFRNAESALKNAKASGERYMFYALRMTETITGRLILEYQLRHALDNEEFVLHYQPKVSMVSGLLTGVEALIRWNDPARGLIPPAMFIPVLEETGLIREVGRWALRRAIDDHLRWRAAGLRAPRIAVNVSALQLRHRNFVSDIKAVVGRDANAANALELEITESVIMADMEQTTECLRTLRALGIRIAIDDFGTGFSSLSYLSRLPIDALKIDRSFVTDMTRGAEGMSLVSAIINLAHSLKLNVVAEGVETQEQFALLRDMKCDEMQGYLFSRPLPCDVIEARYLASPD